MSSSILLASLCQLFDEEDYVKGMEGPSSQRRDKRHHECIGPTYVGSKDPRTSQ